VKQFSVFLIMVFFVTYLNAQNLTPTEQNYLKNKTTIKVINQLNWPPYNYNQDGKPLGFSIDYMNLVGKKLNLNIEYVYGPSWAQFMQMVQDGEVDVMLNILKTKERETFLSFSSNYVKATKTIFSNQKNLDTLEDLKNKTVAVPKEYFIHNFLTKNYPHIKLKVLKDPLECMIAVSNNEADAYIGNNGVVNYLMQKHIISFKYSKIIKDIRLSYGIGLATSKNQTILRDILQKGMKQVSEDEINELRKKWFAKQIKNRENLNLSFNESHYLENKKRLSMCVNPQSMPLEKIEDSVHVGFSYDYINLLRDMLDIPIDLVVTESWSESLQKMKQRECDFLPLLAQTKERDKYMDFSKPYLSIPVVIATKIGLPFSDNINQLKGEKLAVLKACSLVEILKNKYNISNIIEVESIDDGLSKVADGEVFGYLDNSYVINYAIQKDYFETLTISGKYNENIKLSIATRNDEKILKSIFEKGIEHIDPNTKQRILNDWIKIHFKQIYDYKLFFELLFVVVVISIVFIVRHYEVSDNNKKLKEQVEKELEKSREKDRLIFQQNKLSSMGEMIENIAHQWRQPLSQINSAVLLIDDEIYTKNVQNQLIEEKLLEIESMTKYMSNTIDDFKCFYSKSKEKVEFNIKESIENAISIVKASFSYNNISIDLDLEDKIYFYGSPNELQQAILVILNNAKDIIALRGIKSPKVSISLSKINFKTIIRICDNAEGIDTEIMEKIFEPYFTTKHKSQGTGLGLYISKMIIEDTMNGKIYQKNSDSGSCFYIELS